MTASTTDRIPTLRPLIDGARRTLLRFHIVLPLAALAALAAIVEMENAATNRLFEGMLVAASLGLPLLISLRVAGEQRGFGLSGHAGLTLVGLGVLAVVAMLWHGWSEPVRFSRYVQLSVAFHLLVAVAPVRSQGGPQAFWQYNRLLFERFLVAALFSTVLFAGLALALGALDQLFGVDLPRTAFGRLWAVIAFVFNTWYFLAGVPRGYEALDARADYPAGLKVFAQYILIPIVVVYLVILTVYLAKVVLTWEWPSGWIGWLVSSVSVTGILALLLVHPVAREAGTRWVTMYAWGFFVALLPSVVMLWLAVGQRVGQYGVTERRYFLIVLSVWLGAIAIQQLITRSRNIVIIPATLCALALVTAVGPWGAYRVSERSQVSRLEQLLGRSGVLVEGTVRRAERSVPEEDRREIAAVLRYLAETHGTGAIAPWFGGEDALARIDTVENGIGPSSLGEWRARAIFEWLGLEWTGWRPDRNVWFSYAARGGTPVSVAGFDSLLVVRHPSDTATFTGLHARGGPFGRSVAVYRGDVLLARLPLDSLLAALRARGLEPYAGPPIPVEDLTLVREVRGLALSLHISRIEGSWDADTLVVRELSGVLLVGRR